MLTNTVWKRLEVLNVLRKVIHFRSHKYGSQAGHGLRLFLFQVWGPDLGHITFFVRILSAPHQPSNPLPAACRHLPLLPLASPPLAAWLQSLPNTAATLFATAACRSAALAANCLPRHSWASFVWHAV